MPRATHDNMSTVSRSPRKIGLKRKMIYTTICVLATLLVCEGAVRIRAWARYGAKSAGESDNLLTIDKVLGIKVPRPGSHVEGGRIAIKINSLGFRGEEVSLQKPPQTVRIACIGASTTFCAEVSSDQAAWPARFQELPQAKYPQTRIEVINAGVPGYVASEAITNLEHRVLPLQPDLVIFYEANNEIALDTRLLARSLQLIGESESYRSGTVAFLSECSLLFDLVDKNARTLLGRRDTHAGKLAIIPSDLPNAFVGKLGRMHDLLTENNVPLVLSTYVVKYRREQPRPVQTANADIAFFYMPWMTMDALLDAMDYYNQAIVDFAESRSIPVVADTDSIPPDAAHFADCVQLTDQGCEAMALRFMRFFDESRVLDPIVERAAAASG
jgi:lysophospholipase L1-like esterase